MPPVPLAAARLSVCNPVSSALKSPWSARSSGAGRQASWPASTLTRVRRTQGGKERVGQIGRIWEEGRRRRAKASEDRRTARNPSGTAPDPSGSSMLECDLIVSSTRLHIGRLFGHTLFPQSEQGQDLRRCLVTNQPSQPSCAHTVDHQHATIKPTQRSRL
eukprot:361381-Chlamydomonas_euryale.AAC.9